MPEWKWLLRLEKSQSANYGKTGTVGSEAVEGGADDEQYLD